MSFQFYIQLIIFALKILNFINQQTYWIINITNKINKNMTQKQEFNKTETKSELMRIKGNLYGKYSSSRTYYYTNLINEIVNEKRTFSNILYEDVEYLCDQEEYLKRWYNRNQFDSKMFTFKQYYFHHEDCPRIFMKGIQNIYAKWQDKKRDIVYKKLKILYNQEYVSSSDISNSENQNQKANSKPIQHFLMDISEYNPYSKKYYLRVAAKQEKQRNQKRQEKNFTRNQLSFLGHELSCMIDKLGDISGISVLMETPKKQIYYPKKIDKNKKNTYDTSGTNTKSTIKMNFLKKKTERPQQNNQQPKSLQKNKYPQIKISKQSFDKNTPIKRNIQINYETINKDQIYQDKKNANGNYNKNNNFESLKTQSIFSVSSFAALNKKGSLKLNPKRQILKINYDIKEKQAYQTTKPNKIITKSISNHKLVPKKSLQKIKNKQGSGGSKDKGDQFSDKKITKEDSRLRSHKSQFSSLTSLKKPLFKIRPNRNSEHQQVGKRVLQLNNN